MMLHTKYQGSRQKDFFRVFTILYSYFMPVCSIVKTITLRCLNDLMHYFTRPKAECKSASGRPRYGGEIVSPFYKPNPVGDIQSSVS